MLAPTIPAPTMTTSAVSCMNFRFYRLEHVTKRPQLWSFLQARGRMTIDEAVVRLGPTLARDSSGRYSFACKKAFVLVKLHGKPARFRFAARDQVAFRMTGTSF